MLYFHSRYTDINLGGIVVRAGLIIGGLFLMVFGAVLLYTIIFGLIALLFEFIGLIMLIAGLVTSSERVLVTSSPQVIVHGTSEEKKQIVLAICPQCKNRISSESKFCPECGENLQPLNKWN